MNTTVQALQNLYIALGGELADVENIVLIPDMINAIAELKGAETTNNEGGSEESTSDEQDGE